MITVFFMALFMQAGNLQAQNLYSTCTGCTSEDIKASSPYFNPGPNSNCLNPDATFTGQLFVTLDVTSKTRYGLYIEYDLWINGAKFARLSYCLTEDLPQGTYDKPVSSPIQLPANATIELKDVFTAWENQDPDIGGGNGTYFCDKPSLTCSDVDKPRCKTYLAFPVTTVTAKPVVNISAPDAICGGSDAVFTITGTASAAPYTVSLFYKLNVAHEGTPAGTYKEIPNFNGSYEVTVPKPAGSVILDAYLVRKQTGKPDCQGDTKSETITRNTPASAQISTQNPVCAAAVSWPVSVVSTPMIGHWYTSGTGTFADPESQSTTYAPTVADKHAGTVTLTWITADPDGQGPCPGVKDDEVVIINPLPTVDAGGPDFRCESTSAQVVTLSGSSFGNGASCAAWSVVNGPAGLSNTSCTANPATVTYTIPANFVGFITLRLTTNDPDGPCGSLYKDRVIAVTAKGTAVASVETPRICQNQRTKISVESNVLSGSWSGGSGTYWSAAIGGSVVGPTAKMAYYQPGPAEVTAAETNGTTVVNLKWTTVDFDGDGPCSAVESNTISITVQALPMANAGPDKETCAGTPVEVKGMVTKGAYSSVKWTAPSGQFSNNGTTLTTTYTPSITSGTVELTLTVTPAAPCTTPQIAKVIITVSQCVGFCTYTQGYFGQDVGNGRAHYLVGDVCTSTQAAGTITAALNGWGVNGMNLANMNFKGSVAADVAKIREYLPGGGPAATYTGTKEALTSSSPRNVLLAQTMTLGLNMGLNPKLKNYTFTETKGYLKLQSSNDCGKGGTGDTYCSMPYDVSMIQNLNNVAGIQVEDIWMAANKALKESGYGPKSAIAGAAGFINEAFDECAVVIVQSKENPCGDTEGKINPESLMLTETFTAANNGAAKSLAVKAFPNPFKDRVTIQFTAPVSGKAVVEFFDMTGRRLEMINKGQVVAGRVNTVDYMVPAANRNAIIYKVTVDNFSVNGRLISPSK
jgi:hypothetical protein